MTRWRTRKSSPLRVRSPAGPLLASVLIAPALAGCSPPKPGPVVGYTGIVRSAGGVPGQPGRFRLRVRVMRLDGKTDFALPPTIWVDDLTRTRAPGPTYSERIIRFPGKNFCEISLQGTLAPPTPRTTTLAVSLYESREVPVWRRLITTLSTQSVSEISARTPLGTFVVPAVTAWARTPSARVATYAAHPAAHRELVPEGRPSIAQRFSAGDRVG